MDALEKPLVWLHGEVKTPPFSADGRIEAGVLLRRLQMGEKLRMPRSRPMRNIGRGCHELRITDKNATWPIIHFIDTDAPMNAAKKKRLESAGWKIGTGADFLGLSQAEARIVEMKLALSESLRRHRLRKRLTQQALAKRLGSSQSRVAKLESGALGVRLDLLFRALFAAGVTTNEIAREIRQRKRSAA